MMYYVYHIASNGIEALLLEQVTLETIHIVIRFNVMDRTFVDESRATKLINRWFDFYNKIRPF